MGDKNPMKRPEVIMKRLNSWKKGNHKAWNKGIKTGPNPLLSEKMKRHIPPNKGQKLSLEERNSLSYCIKWIVIEPNGNEIFVNNLNSWCEGKNLCATNLRSVAAGRRKDHKGYKCKKMF